MIPNYAHMDCFLGKNAARDVYPVVLKELDRHNSAVLAPTRRTRKNGDWLGLLFPRFIQLVDRFLT